MKQAAAVLLWCVIVLFAIAAMSQTPQNPSPELLSYTPADFDKLVNAYFDQYFKFHPSEATAAGFHEYDSQFEDLSAPARAKELAFLTEFKQEFGIFHPDRLDEQQKADLKLVANAVNARLLELQEVRMWERDPDLYSSAPSASIFVLINRKFAPPEQRLQAVTAREQKLPAWFAAAKSNLKNPPRVYTEIALEQLPGIIGFFQHDVPAAFKDVTDRKLLSDFKAANDKTIDELERYQNFLQKDLLPISKGDFRLGAEKYKKKLLYEEMTDIPLDRLLQIGYDDLHRNQAELKRVAAIIDAKRTPEQFLAQAEQDHPKPDQLLQSFRNTFDSLIEFIQQKHIITIPSDIRPIVEETPPFARALTSASMDTPGAYEMKATEAYFNVTLPEANWPPQRTKEWMRGFNRGTITSTAIHEAYPGHYEQFLWQKQLPTKVRKLTGSGTNIEGWAHYTEQMMLDEGYGNGDPKLRLGQIQDALLRDARYIVGIEMHTGNMTLEQGTQFFIREGHQTPTVAEREAKRGTSDPTYLMYTLGKLEILKLREDYKKKMGSQFSLQQFHDEFMKQGFAPIKIIRKAMLGDDSPVF